MSDEQVADAAWELSGRTTFEEWRNGGWATQQGHTEGQAPEAQQGWRKRPAEAAEGAEETL